jgi:hypothetical protein
LARYASGGEEAFSFVALYVTDGKILGRDRKGQHAVLALLAY